MAITSQTMWGVHRRECFPALGLDVILAHSTGRRDLTYEGVQIGGVVESSPPGLQTLVRRASINTMLQLDVDLEADDWR